MKNNYMITGEATKYWKKAIKKDRVWVCNKGGVIYILNGYNAFKMPAAPHLWDQLARPAFMVDMPEPGDAFHYDKGEKLQADIDFITLKVDGAAESTTRADRLPFMYGGEKMTLRLYKNDFGSIAGVDIKYDAMVDASIADTICCGGKYSPVVFKDKYFTALIMPVKLCDKFPEHVARAFCSMEAVKK